MKLHLIRFNVNESKQKRCHYNIVVMFGYYKNKQLIAVVATDSYGVCFVNRN